LQWCQVQAGTAKHLLGNPHDSINYIETFLIMCIRNFLWTYNLRIDFLVTPLPVAQCIHNEFIMDVIRERGGCTATKLQRINACRMCLQVARILDISSADRVFLRAESLAGIQSQTYQLSSQWPRRDDRKTCPVI
jgi:hypothetical protein